MKKLIYTFILAIGFQFAQAQEVTVIWVPAEGDNYTSLDEASYPPINPPGVNIIPIFEITNTGNEDMSVGDTIAIVVYLNDTVVQGGLFTLNGIFQKDSIIRLQMPNEGKVPLLTRLLKSGTNANALCATVVYVTVNFEMVPLMNKYCAYFTAEPTNNIVADVNLKEAKVYPNPVRDNLNIENLSENTYITVYSITGQLVKSIPTVMGSVSIDMSDISSGMYIVKMQSGQNVRTEKIQVIK